MEQADEFGVSWMTRTPSVGGVFQLSGYGNPEDEAERIRYLLSRGATGFIMEHDRMTADNLYDVDHPEIVARREDVGISGAVIMSVHDCELALEGIDQAANYAHAGGAGWPSMPRSRWPPTGTSRNAGGCGSIN